MLKKIKQLFKYRSLWKHQRINNTQDKVSQEVKYERRNKIRKTKTNLELYFK